MKKQSAGSVPTNTSKTQLRKCELCHHTFHLYKEYKAHYKVVHHIDFLQCQFCNNEYPSINDLNNHVKEKHLSEDNQRYECQECASSFKHEKSLKYHKATIHAQNRQLDRCEDCGTTFKYRSSYLKHRRLIHGGLGYFKCDKCSKLFHQKQTLKRHQEVQHTENFERLQCQYCITTFKYRENLAAHVKRKHYANVKTDSLEELKYKCYSCSEKFRTKTELFVHQNKVHNKKMDIYECKQCSAVFRVLDSYKHHLKEQHDELNCDIIEVEEKNYKPTDVVDFENVIKNDSHLKQLIKVKERCKKDNKKIIVVENESEYSDIDIDDDEVDVIKRNIKQLIVDVIRVSNHDYVSADYESKKEAKEIVEIEISPEYENEGKKVIETEVLETKLKCTSEEEVDVKNTSFLCVQCSEMFGSDELLLYHMAEVHRITMEDSDKISSVTDNEVSDNISDTALDLLTPIKNNNQKKKQMNTKEIKGNCDRKAKSYTCEKCHKIHKLKAHLVRHAKKCKMSSRAVKKNIKENEVEGSKSMFLCLKCGAIFPNEELLRNHQLWAHESNVTLHKCCKCSVIFYRLSDLQQHLEKGHL